MLGGNNTLDENCYQYPVDVSNQLELVSNESKIVLFFVLNKRGRESEPYVTEQKLQISLNHNIRLEDSGRLTSMLSQNLVSTGLKLSYDEERNSFISSVSGSMTGAQPMMLSLGDSITSELDRQKEEFDRYIKTQVEHMVKGVRDIKLRHMTSFLATLQKEVGKKIREKDLELEAINLKNRELVNQIKQVATEAQNWHYKAKYNESIVNILKLNLQQALSQGAEQVKEGLRGSDIDDTASCIDPHNFLVSGPIKSKSTMLEKGKMVFCRCCKAKEVSVLLMPCRHLSLCGFVKTCPVCQSVKTFSVQVFLS